MVIFLRASARGHLSMGLVLLAALAGCKPPPDNAIVPASATPTMAPVPAAGGELQALRAEVARLKAENARLRITPFALAAEVQSAVQGNDAAKAEAALKQLADTFPHSVEVAPARKRVETLLATLRAQEAQRLQVAAQGFRALKVQPTFAHDGLALSLAGTQFTRRWIFDSYSDGIGWRYLDAERGQRLLVAQLAVTSKTKDPALFGIGLYRADGSTMTLLGSLRYRFTRWLDYGAYLGTHADYRNDFSHRARIPFSAGVALPQEQALRRPLYLVATREGCHKRHHDRLVQPPVHYIPGPCVSLKNSLTVEDFKDGSLAVLRRIE